MADQKIDKAKGRIREAPGALAGDPALKNRGRGEQATGSMKKAVDKVQENLAGRKATRPR
jgi:uncharacterized protein YjbJ (UPF0337 family)